MANAMHATNHTIMECSICLEECHTHHVVLTCTHTFHRSCIGQWFDKGITNCPMCRSLVKLNDYHTFSDIVKKLEANLEAVTRQLEKIDKVPFKSLTPYWQEKVDNLEYQYLVINDKINGTDSLL